MRAALFFIVLLLCVSVFSQTIGSIDTLVQRIDNTIYNDTIVIVRNTKSLERPCQITGYFSGDTLMKTISLFNNSTRKRLTYYSCEIDWIINKPCFVVEIDSIDHSQLTNVYGYEKSFNNYKVLKYEVKEPLDSVYLQHPGRLLWDADYTIDILHALIDRRAEKYHFKVRLTKALPLPAGCGRIAFALLQKFEVISTDFPNYDKKFVLLIQPCPEFLGNSFFHRGKVYDVYVATNSGVAFDYDYRNIYEKENLPVFWNRKIIRRK